MTNILLAILFLPILSAAVITLFTLRRPTVSAGISIGSSCLTFILSVLLYRGAVSQGLPLEISFTWLPVGALSVELGFLVDRLSLLMLLVVTGIGSLIHIYSRGYMQGDPSNSRYCAGLSIFMFSMTGIVLANNLLMIFIFWEMVGLSSYLLIGFWMAKPSAADAGKKAFLCNRVGDTGFLLGIIMLWGTLGTLGFSQINSLVAANPAALGSWTTLVGLLLFCGVVGKSAQFPLHVWLPDAMEGPTPVSSLIHAATMVTAGVYMIARLNFLYVLAPTTLLIVTVVGLLTAFFAATFGCAQYDIKRVLAYSTVSQLGYMFVGVGAGAYAAGIFHLMTHAFFKGLVYLAAGSVMHAMGGELDMRKMGGLRKKIPITYWTTFIACLAIAGVPGLSGFFSKDEILWMAFSRHHSFWFWLIGAATAGMTAFYVFRMFFNTFHGECRASEEVKHHIHESPKVMTIPLMILAVLSIIGGYVGVPHLLGGSNHIEKWLEPVFGHHAPATAHAGGFSFVNTAFASSGEAAGIEAGMEMKLMIGAIIIGLLGIFIAWLFYVKNPNLPKKFVEKFHGLFTLVHNKYFIDELYGAVFVKNLFRLGALCKEFFDETIIDGIINGVAAAMGGIGSLVRRVQSGFVQGYAFAIILGAIIVIGYLVSRMIL